MFSASQNLSRSELDEMRMQEAIDVVNFGVECCRRQMRMKRYFIFEHPQSASSWKLGSLYEVAEDAGSL